MKYLDKKRLFFTFWIAIERFGKIRLKGTNAFLPTPVFPAMTEFLFSI